MNAITERSHAKRVSIRVTLAFAAIVTALCAFAAKPAAAAVKPQPKPRPNFAPHVGANIIITRGDFLGRQRSTWYGPGFFGRRTACGQTLQRSTWGVAHRTLPCGTLVTLTRGAKKVSVRVIDRGPFSHASLDLTARTRDYLGFVDGSVNMAVVTGYRLARH